MSNYFNSLMAFGQRPSLGQMVDERRNLNANTNARNLLSQQVQQEMTQKSTLADLLPRYIQGDKSVLPQIAGASPDTYLALDKRQMERQTLQRDSEAEQNAKLGRMVIWANTEEKWAATPFGQQGIPFEQREAALGQFVGNKDVFEAANPKVTNSIRTLETLQARPDLMQIEMQRNRSGGGTPYFTPVQTAEGVYSFNNRSGQMALIDGGQGPVVGAQNDPTLQARLSYGKEAGKGAGEVDIQQHETAKSAVTNIEKIDTLIAHLNESDAITGMGADFFKNIERAKVLVLNSEKAGKKVSDTEILDVMMGSEVFPLIGALGIGARGMDTPAEREFMRSVLTGQISLNKDTLLRMAKIRKDISQRAIDRWNSRVKTGELDRYFDVTGRPKESIEIPGASQPKGGVRFLGFE